MLFTVSVYVRKPYEAEGFHLSDATYHVLLTMQAYDETPASIHKWLPIQTFGDECNKYIANGPSLIQDENGNSFYISFSPLGFYLPYFFCKLFHLNLSIGSLYVFNCLLMLISALLSGYVMKLLLKDEIAFWFSALLYLVIPEVLYTQGIVYWHHSLSQVLLLLQIILFIILFVDRKRSRSLWCMFFIVSFLYPYLEWTGYISNVGMAIGLLLLEKRILKEKDRINVSISFFSLKVDLLLGLVTILACGYYLFRFSSIASIKELVAMLFSRAGDRYEATLAELISGYKESFWPIMLGGLICFFITMVFKASRNELIQIFKNKNNRVMVFIFLFPLLENIILKEHAVLYTFDRLKASMILIFLISVCLYALWRSYRLKACVVGIPLICACTVVGFNTYDSGKIVTLDQYSDTIVMRDYLNEQYLGSGKNVVVKSGWRAWGYLQTLYHRNMYCTFLYSEDEIDEIARNNGSDYIVTLEATSSDYIDTACYTRAVVEALSSNKYYQISVEDGIVNSEEITEVCTADYTDENWTNGIRNDDNTEILFNNTNYNYTKLSNAQKLYINNREYKVINIEYDDMWIRVWVDSDATECAYPSAVIPVDE
ncbi:hypothetical protein SAMN02910382_02744 [Butyrivibrio sp. TB]|nr:hypothetical protein SAMN02910382_02744 [Butyrivibrio sp. TB]